MGTRRTLVGGEDFYPADLGGDRQSSFHIAFSTGWGEHDFSTNYTWIPLWQFPKRQFVLLGSTIVLSGTSTNDPSNTPTTTIYLGVGDPYDYLDYSITNWTIPNTSWVGKSPRTNGATYPATGAGTFGNHGYGIGVGNVTQPSQQNTNTFFGDMYYGGICIDGNAISGGGTSYDYQIGLDVHQSGYTSTMYGVQDWDWYVELWGFWL